MLDEYTARNNAALQSLVDEHGVQLRRLPDDVLLALWQGTQVVMQELVESDPMAAKVYASYSEFYKGVRNYHHISEQAYLNARDKVFGDERFLAWRWSGLLVSVICPSLRWFDSG